MTNSSIDPKMITDLQMDPKIALLGLVLYLIWVLPWKGIALWRAAKRGHKKWFVALLILFNTLGILDIIYFFIFSKRERLTSEVKQDKKKSETIS